MKNLLKLMVSKKVADRSHFGSNIESTQWNNLRFFPKSCTHVFNNINFILQGFQLGAFQQRYLKCKCETPYFEGELVPKTCKNWKMSSKRFFLSGLVTKLENLFVFGKNWEKISSNGWFQKKLLTDLTSARTLKVGKHFVTYRHFCIPFWISWWIIQIKYNNLLDRSIAFCRIKRIYNWKFSKNLKYRRYSQTFAWLTDS